MKFHFYPVFISLLVISAFYVFISCSSSKKAALACPEFPASGYGIKARHGIKNDFIAAFRSRSLRPGRVIRHKSTDHNIVRSTGRHDTGTGRTDKSRIPEPEPVVNFSLPDYRKGLIAFSGNGTLIASRGFGADSTSSGKRNKVKADNTTQQEPCDTIISKMGVKIIGNIIAAGDYEVRYRRCGETNGPSLTIRRSNISSIIYASGKHIDAAAVTPAGNSLFKTATESSQGKIELFGMAGFLSDLAGLFVLSIPLGILGIVLGIISLIRMHRDPDRYRGKGFAFACILLGISEVIGGFMFVF